MRLTVAALVLAACSSTKEYCEQLCECQGGCSDAQLDTCIDDLSDEYSDAASDGCREQADDYLSCLATEPQCRAGGVLDTSRCDDEVSALARCRQLKVGSGGSGGAGASGAAGGTGNVVGAGAAGGAGGG